LNHFGMSGLAGADFLVGWVRGESAGIANECAPHAIHLPIESLSAPETTEGEGSCLHPFGEWWLNTIAIDGVVLRHFEDISIAPGKRGFGGGHFSRSAE